jgi:serine/threonine-protein kinase
MIHRKNTLIISVLGVAAILSGLALHNHMVRVKAAKLANATPPAPYFPPGAVWYQDVSNAPVDPQSSEIISWLANAGGWGNNNKLEVDFAIRVVEANATTPFVPYRPGVGFMIPDSDAITSFPLPIGGGAEGQKNYQCPAADEDCHLIVADRKGGKLYEAYQANYAENVLTSSFVAVWDLNRVYPPSGRGEQCTSADAAGFPIAPLLFNADELAAGSINHAIRFILPNPRMRAKFYVHPATHAGGPSGPASAPPYGVHFRLKSSFDVSQLSPPAQVVARAMQKYGMFLSDGGKVALTAQNDLDTTTKYADLGFGPRDLQAIKVTDFEVLTMGKPIPLTYECERNK